MIHRESTVDYRTKLCVKMWYFHSLHVSELHIPAFSSNVEQLVDFRFISNVSSPFVWLLQSGRLRLGDLQQHPHGVELVVRRFDLGELDQSDSQGPDIGLVVIRSVLHGLTHHHLRGHPGENKKGSIYRDRYIVMDTESRSRRAAQ